MAIDNLNIMTSGIPAGQQTDKYSSQPGCLRSKNLDIFSSSKSVKGTAWSEGTQIGSDIIKQVGSLVLKTDGKVYDDGVEIADPDDTFPTTTVSYDGRYGTFDTAIRGTSKDMVAQYEGGDLKTFNVFSDQAQYNYNTNGFIFQKTFPSNALTNLVRDDNTITRETFAQVASKGLCQGYMIQKSDNNATRGDVEFNIPTSEFGKIKFSVGAYKYNGRDDDAVPYISNIEIWNWEHYYSPQTNTFVSLRNGYQNITYGDTYDIYTPEYIELEANPNNAGTAENSNNYVRIHFQWKQKDGRSTYKREDRLMVNFMGGPDQWRVEEMSRDYGDGIETIYADTYYTYNLLPIKSDRKLKEVGGYYWEKGVTTQTFYKYVASWKEDPNAYDITDYKLKQYMAWDNPPGMDVVSMISWNERVYMIGNMYGNGSIIPCDLTGGKGTPYIAYGCTFKGAINIDYLLYLVGDDRGISQLRAFNSQELSPITGGKRKDGEDYVDTDEQYKFNGMMVEYRGNIVLATEDNRLFEYGKTYGGKGGSFILDVPGTLTGIKVQGDDLIVSYSITTTVGGVETTTNYITTYQDDVAKKNYLDREAEYPIAIGNHLLEKEESDLYLSYKIPNKDCSLEFWGNANHYTFWTFTVENPGSMEVITNHFKIDNTNGSYYLEYVEDHGDEYTFKLVGDLPSQTATTSKTLLYYDEENEQWISWGTYEKYNHFRYIGEITADGFMEGEYRFHNLNNKLDLPRSHTLQVKVIGKGNGKGSPELFVLDLVANQRNRG